jgi:hypothetical protein
MKSGFGGILKPLFHIQKETGVYPENKKTMWGKGETK